MKLGVLVNIPRTRRLLLLGSDSGLHLTHLPSTHSPGTVRGFLVVLKVRRERRMSYRRMGIMGHVRQYPCCRRRSSFALLERTLPDASVVISVYESSCAVTRCLDELELCSESIMVSSSDGSFRKKLIGA
jgi:hypothetical protein